MTIFYLAILAVAVFSSATASVVGFGIGSLLTPLLASRYGTSYAPGSLPSAPDWNQGEGSCGGGLHLSPRPYLGLEFTHEVGRFVACPVRLEDIAIGSGPYRNKVRAKAVCAPVYEVDDNGRPV